MRENLIGQINYRATLPSLSLARLMVSPSLLQVLHFTLSNDLLTRSYIRVPPLPTVVCSICLLLSPLRPIYPLVFTKFQNHACGFTGVIQSGGTHSQQNTTRCNFFCHSWHIKLHIYISKSSFLLAANKPVYHCYSFDLLESLHWLHIPNICSFYPSNHPLFEPAPSQSKVSYLVDVERRKTRFLSFHRAKKLG